MGAGFQFYIHPGKVQQLATTQQSAWGRFDAIMQAIDGQARGTLQQWEGAGNPQFARANSEYHAHFGAVQAAFRKLISTTDEAAGRGSTLVSRLDGMF
jgi:uncharacterized protein YukE